MSGHDVRVLQGYLTTAGYPTTVDGSYGATTKRNVIETYGMGTNAKIHVEVSHKTWPALGYSGATYTGPDGNHVAWDDSVPLGANGGPAICDWGYSRVMRSMGLPGLMSFARCST